MQKLVFRSSNDLGAFSGHPKASTVVRPSIRNAVATKCYQPQQAKLQNVLLTKSADGSITSSTVQNTAVTQSTLNPYARENYVKIVANLPNGDIDDSNLEAIATAFMVGKNLEIDSEIVDGIVEKDGDKVTFSKATTMSFHMLGQLNNTITRNTNLVQSPTIPIDSGRQFDIIQLPYSTQDALTIVAVPFGTNESLVLKDLKDSLKIIWADANTRYDVFIGRCKTTLNDAYTPFGDLPNRSKTFFIDETATINLNS